MGYVAKLTRGKDTLDLSSGRYSLGLDYKPGASSFSVKISGLSSAEVRKGVDDLNLFLSNAGDPANPTRFWWNPDSNVSAAPVWGQRERSVEVLGGGVEYWDSYFEADVRSTTAFVKVSMVFGSVVEGAKQLAATATGGIVEDWIGVTDGQSRGVMIPPADATNGNKMTNPMFGHPTWNTGWTAGADITATKNTELDFIIIGLASARIKSTGATNTFTQSIAVGNTNAHVLSCYAKSADGSAVSSTQCQLYYGAAKTTTYTAVGNGWYRLTAAITGIAGATATGILVNQHYTIYADAFQVEERGYVTPFFYGDMLGCAWAGTAHESKSYRNLATLSIPTANTINGGSGTVRVVWKADHASTAIPSTDINYLFCDSGGGFLFAYDSNGNTWDIFGSMFPADTFASGETIIFHIVWSPITTSVFYKNGSQVTSYPWGAFPVGTTLFIGSYMTGTYPIGGTFLDFSIFNYPMTATEALADYNNVTRVISDGQKFNSILYEWTKDGDNTVDNVDSGASENIAVIGGVPGDLPAKVDAQLTVGGMAAADLYLGRLDWGYNEYIDPAFLTNASLGTVPIGTADTTITYIGFMDDEFRLVEGRKVSVMMRAIEGTAAGLNNIRLRTGISPGGAFYYTPYLETNWGTAGTTTIDSSPEIYFVQDEEFYRTLGITRAGSVFIGAKRTSGSADMIVHSVGILPSPTTRFTNLSAGTASPVILYTNGKAYEATGTSLSYGYQVTGAPLEVMPNRYNILVSYLGREGVTSAATNTLAYSSVYITPRWRLA